MKKLVLFIITSLLFTFLCLSVSNTYSLFTKKIDKTGSISTIKSEATFLNGNSFNAKIKSISGDSNATWGVENETIINIERSATLLINPTNSNIVSDSNSIMPIYAWFNNGTLYYYSEANTLYMNENANLMFARLSNVESIDVSTINTSRTRYMLDIFGYDYKLTTLDVSNFDTSIVENMQGMFFRDYELVTIDVSKFNTANLVNMQGMFQNAYKVEIVDMSNFDLTNVTNSSGIFNKANSLKEYKTPKVYPNDTTQKIGLPKTMYDENMVAYTTLGKSTTPTSPTQTWLKEGYTVSFDADGGTVSPSSKVVRKDGTYGNLPTPTKDGYTFKGWNGKNLANYNEYKSVMAYFPTSVDSNGNVSLTTPEEDRRPWSYANSEYKMTLSAGTYTLSLDFSVSPSNVGAQTYSGVQIIRKNGSVIYPLSNGSLYNKDNFKTTFTIDSETEIGIMIKMYDGVYKIQLEKGDTVTNWEPYYVTSSTNVTIEQNHTLKAIWEPNKYNLTINPNGGVYNSTTNNTVVEQDMDSLYSLSSPTKEGYTFTGWSLTNNGTLLRGNASGYGPVYDSVTRSLVTDLDGSTYTNYKVTNYTTGDSYYWPRIQYPTYSFTVGHTYRVSFESRVNSVSNLNYLSLRHAAYNNDHNSIGKIAKSILNDVGLGWQHYSLERTYSSSTISTTSNTTNTVNPMVEIYLEIKPNTTASVDFDIRNIIVEDVTEGTFVTDSTYGNYIYKYGAGSGTLTAQYTPNTYIVVYNNTCDYTGSGTMQNSTFTYGTNETLRNNSFSCNKVVTYNYNGATGGNSVPTQNSTSNLMGWTVGAPNILRNKNFLNTSNMTQNSDGTLQFYLDDNTGIVGSDTYKFANFFYKSDISVPVDTNFVYIADIKSMTNTGEYTYNNRMIVAETAWNAQIQTGTNPYLSSLNLGLNYIQTKTTQTYSNPYALLRGFVQVHSGSAVSMRFRPILFEGTYNNKDLYYYNLATVNSLAPSGTVNLYTDWSYETTITLPTPVKEEYVFDGWYSDEQLTTKVGNGGDSYLPLQNQTLYAKWLLTANFNAQGGTVSPASKVITYNQVYSDLPTPTKTNYGFLGWNTSSDGTGTYITSSSIVSSQESVTLYAIWQDNTSLTAGKTWNFDYNGTDGSDGSAQRFIPPVVGTYKIELWGAQGGGNNEYITGGYGGYTKGNIDLDTTDNLFIYVGGMGSQSLNETKMKVPGGYNGGGATNGQNCCNRIFGTGGGATDVRLTDGVWNDFSSLKSRIMVAGAGGGSFYQDYHAGTSYDNGGIAGGLDGYEGNQTWQYCYGTGGTQIQPGIITTNCSQSSNYSGGTMTGGFGYGGGLDTQASTGGGSGYYGGSKSGHVASAGGGSSFISGYSGCDAISSSSISSNIIHTGQPNHYSGKIFNTGTMQMIDGAGCDWSTGSATNCGSNQIQPNGTNATGHTGNGYARITLISLD